MNNTFDADDSKYCLRDIVKMSSNYLRDKIFKLESMILTESNEPRYIHFKIKKLLIEGVEKTLVQ
jgi:hypothetical protein